MTSPLARALPGLYLLSLGVLTLSRPAHPLSCPCRPAGVSPFPPTERETNTSLSSTSLAAYICFYKNPPPRTLPVPVLHWRPEIRNSITRVCLMKALRFTTQAILLGRIRTWLEPRCKYSITQSIIVLYIRELDSIIGKIETNRGAEYKF